jgi:hypothetical protein
MEAKGLSGDIDPAIIEAVDRLVQYADGSLQFVSSRFFHERYSQEAFDGLLKRGEGSGGYDINVVTKVSMRP